MPVPPPSAALERALAELRPTRTRRPARVVVGVAAASLVYAAAAVWKLGLRSDLPQLPLVPFALHATAGLAAFVALLWSALVPPRGHVLPSGTTAARSTAVLLGALLVLELVFTPRPLGGGAPAPLSLDGSLVAAGRCLGTAFGVVVPTVALGLWSLRRLLVTGGWRGLVAIGGAAGALGGLVLHLRCATSDAGHIGLVHGAALVLPSVLLALAGPDRLPSQAGRHKSDREPRHGR